MPALLISTFIIIASLCVMYLHRHRVLHPSFWTNAGFVGYGVGGLYHGLTKFSYASFLDLAGIDEGREYWFTIATAIIVIGFIACNLGFYLGDKLAKNMKFNENTPELSLTGEHLLIGKVVALILIFIGISYYIYFSNIVAGGIVGLIKGAGVYRYIVADSGLSALPFHLVYGGALLWLLTWLSSVKHKWLGLIFIPLGMFIILSTGRIALSNMFAISAIFTFLYIVKKSVDWKAFTISLSLLFPLNIAFYFWRQYTSYVYIGKREQFALLQNSELKTKTSKSNDTLTHVTPEPMNSIDNSEANDTLISAIPEPMNFIDSHVSPYLVKVSYILKSLIGGGNVPDLQQIILIVKGVMDERLALTYGATYFDWIYNLLASRIGVADGNPKSVGYRILEAYFPDKTGGPTPGMIGEAILNFGALSPFALIAFALAVTILYYKAIASSSAFFILIYCIFLIGIWALFLKVDSSLLFGYLWSAGPICLIWGALIMSRGYVSYWFRA